LYDYFSFLQAHELSWVDVDRGEKKTLLVAYRDYCFRVAKLARSTVRNRLLYVCEFYEFAVRQKWIARLPFDYEVRSCGRVRSLLSHLHTGRHAVARDVMPRSHQSHPRYLSVAQVKILLGAASNPHHRMVLRLALGSGLRKEELATFPLAYVFNPDRNTQSRNIRIHLDPRDGHGIKTKGSRERAIFITRGLMRDLHQYTVHYRGERASSSQRPQASLFLNQDGQPFSDDGKSLDRIVRLIGQKAGLKVWTHMLRHTYATHTLVALQRNRAGNRLEPLVFLQKQLGHASPQSTLIYLHLINELADDAVLAYDEELEALAGGFGG
jgi:integrase